VAECTVTTHSTTAQHHVDAQHNCTAPHCVCETNLPNEEIRTFHAQCTLCILQTED
jgi:hypothetical protein